MTDTLAHIETRPKRRHRARHGMGQYVTDLELIEYLGLPVPTGRQVLQRLDDSARNGFPKKDPFFGDRRYLPAVDDWCDAYFDRKMGASKGRTAHG